MIITTKNKSQRISQEQANWIKNKYSQIKKFDYKKSQPVYFKAQDDDGEKEHHDLVLKKMLEVPFYMWLTRFMQNSSDDVFNQYAETGILGTFQNSRQKLQRALNKHHKRVSKKFDNRIRSQNRLVRGQAQQINGYLDDSLDRIALYESNDVSGRILDTSDKHAVSFINSAILGGAVMLDDIAETAQSDFDSRIPGRSTTISITETQKAAEGSKMEEIKALQVHDAQFVDGADVDDLIKIWLTMGDDLVREWHVLADGQQVMSTEPFIVMGQSLMFPGDDSMGATIENIINCRCVMETRFANSSKNFIYSFAQNKMINAWKYDNGKKIFLKAA